MSDNNINIPGWDSSEDVEETKVENMIESVNEQRSMSMEDNKLPSLTEEELNDPNKIKVTLVDPDVPIVVFFGPNTCGKTMTMIRLSRYLISVGYNVSPVTSFRPKYDKNYKKICNDFNVIINSDYASESTNAINFMLINVSKRGRTVCNILEAPGEYYFDPKNPMAPFPNYVNAIINSSNRKIWAIMIEPDKTTENMEQSDRKNYVSKIRLLKQNIRPRDRVMFIYNKIDETPFVVSPGIVNMKLVQNSAQSLYNNLFDPFKNNNPITCILKPYKCDLIAFQTGTYSKTLDGRFTFEAGPKEYPELMWNLIMKRIKG